VFLERGGVPANGLPSRGVFFLGVFPLVPGCFLVKNWRISLSDDSESDILLSCAATPPAAAADTLSSSRSRERGER